FTPHFPTYGPNIERRGARAVYSPLRQENEFRPDLNDVDRFVRAEPRARAVFLNSPHNPTGGGAPADDPRGLAGILPGRDGGRFRKKVELLVAGLREVDGVKVLMPAGTFYAFPDVSAVCRRLGIRSHGLAMYLLEGADDRLGVACLGGECFGPAGQGFLRFSC